MDKQYLGDSVYIEEGNFFGQLKLTTDNGLGPSNEIFLEPEVLQQLIQYAKADGIIKDE